MKCSWVKLGEFNWEEVKCRQVWGRGVKVFVTGCLPSLDDMRYAAHKAVAFLTLYHTVNVLFCIFVCMAVYCECFCVIL